MAYSDRVLALDVGAASVKAAEFEYSAKGEITLVNFVEKEYSEELTDANRTGVLGQLLHEIIQEKGMTAKKALISLSGQSAFIRFVKLPPVSDEEKRVRQIVEFEARQNVPFPMDEVIWDYQLIASSESDEMDVMFVVIKNDNVEQVTRAVQGVGLDPVLVDVAPVACYNSARANRVGDDECVVILNIGARCSNLLFVDRSRFFARTIPIAGHTITQQIAKEFNISAEEAEKMKRHHGFVGLGGAYESTESEVAATISKIVRNVMTRLHGEVNRSINVYRAQQKGNRPTRMYLSGGSSVMAYTDRFFREACDMEVSYLNPFQVVSMGPDVDLKELEKNVHVFSEVVGLGLRHRVQCPVEINLLPDVIRKTQVFKRKKPYLYGSAAALVCIAFFGLLAEKTKKNNYEGVLQETSNITNRLAAEKKNIEKEFAAQKSATASYAQVTKLLEQRRQIPSVLNELQRLKPAQVWLTELHPIYEDVKTLGVAASGASPAASRGMFGFSSAGTAATSLARPAQAARKIYGFLLHGYSVSVKKHAKRAGGGGGDEKADGLPVDESVFDGTGAAPPVQVFLENLQQSSLFDKDSQKTGITASVRTKVQNMDAFSIQVRLQQPITN